MRKSVLAMFVAILSVSANAASCDSPELKGMVAGLNQSVPKRVDNVTTVTGAECKNGSLKYVYALNDADGIEFSKFDESQKNVFNNVQSNILKNLYCTSLVELHKYTNSVIWSYMFDDKKFAEFEFKPSDCEK